MYRQSRKIPCIYIASKGKQEITGFWMIESNIQICVKFFKIIKIAVFMKKETAFFHSEGVLGIGYNSSSLWEELTTSVKEKVFSELDGTEKFFRIFFFLAIFDSYKFAEV